MKSLHHFIQPILSGNQTISLYKASRFLSDIMGKNMKKWEEIFTEADRELLKKFGRDERLPYGEKPALIIVDVVKSFSAQNPRQSWSRRKSFERVAVRPGGRL